MGDRGTEDDADRANSGGVLPADITRRRLPAATPPCMAGHYRLASAEALQQIIDAVPNPIFVKDREHRWVILNKALVRLLGCAQEELLGKSDFDVFPREQAAVFWAKDDEVFATGCPNENEEAFTDHTGKVHAMLTRKCLVQVEGTDESYLVGVISDVTQYREAEAHSRHLAYHEPLTGLPNRALFQKRLEEALQRAKKAGEGLALLLVDLDGLKAVNDLNGHAAGDELLRVVAKRLSAETKSSDTVARLGGDEFGVVQASSQQPETALALARRIGSAMAAPIVVGEQQAVVSASIGIALFPDHGVTEEDLLHHADIALYTVKRRGRNDYLFYSPELKAQAGRRLEADLRTALQRGQLRLAFQPMVLTVDGTITGHEALLRWHHPTLGEIPPDTFVPIAEATGLIGALGAWALREACIAAANWPEAVRVAVNLSPLQFMADNLPALVAQIINETGLPAERLELEITERALLSVEESALRAFAQLKALGVRVAIDDFGTGWSSLSILHRLAVDRIKIDQSFVVRLPADRRALAIVRAVIGLARDLGVAVTAEGIEHTDQFDVLRELGCSEVQGALLGQPAQASQSN